jgi:hypothetical protein
MKVKTFKHLLVFLATYFKPCVKNWRFFLNLDHVLAIENLLKHLISYPIMGVHSCDQCRCCILHTAGNMTHQMNTFPHLVNIMSSVIGLMKSNQTEAAPISSHEHHDLATQLLKLLIKTSASAKEVSA